MKKISYILQISILKTIYANLTLFPIKVALRFPLLVGHNTKLDIKRGGGVILNAPAKFGLVSFGIGGSQDLRYFECTKNYLGIREGSKVIFNGKAHFAVHSSVLAAGGNIEFGEGFSSNNGCKISSITEVTFGKNVLLGGNCVVRDSDGHMIYAIENDEQKEVTYPNALPVRIGDHVWLANNVHVLKNVEIEHDVIIGYGSIVTKSITESFSVAAGNPATVKKHAIGWRR